MAGVPDRVTSTTKDRVKAGKPKTIFNKIRAKYKNGDEEVIFLWLFTQWFTIPEYGTTFRIYQLDFNFEIVSDDLTKTLAVGVPGDYVIVDMMSGAYEMRLLTPAEKRKLTA